MIFSATAITGAWLVDLQRREDERGFFARVWCEEEFAARGLTARFVQCNTSFSQHAGTLRGLHYQAAPHGEVKLIQCTRGSVFDVIVDVRPDSPTYLKWFGVELSEDNKRLLYVPAGCAHGYQTLRDASEVLYPVSAPYTPSAERGVRWNDPTFAIAWPLAPHRRLSPKDEAWPDFVHVAETTAVSKGDRR
jgi:dTDP-4-dehydrorhamnose 3,5-epimerase